MRAPLPALSFQKSFLCRKPPKPQMIDQRKRARARETKNEIKETYDHVGALRHLLCARSTGSGSCSL